MFGGRARRRRNTEEKKIAEIAEKEKAAEDAEKTAPRSLR
jgi:hypothetical protein